MSSCLPDRTEHHYGAGVHFWENKRGVNVTNYLWPFIVSPTCCRLRSVRTSSGRVGVETQYLKFLIGGWGVVKNKIIFENLSYFSQNSH